MDLELNSEEQEFYDSFREFCQRKIAPTAAAMDAAGMLPRERWQELGRAGYNGLGLPAKYGGDGASYLLNTLAHVALGEACGSSFLSVGASVSLFGGPIAIHGSDLQRQQHLPELIAGNEIGCLAVTEPGAGSDVSALRCNVRQRGDEFLLNGQKTYITNAPLADYALTLARTFSEDGRDLGLTHWIVDLHAAGVSRGKPMEKLGFRASPTGELFFEDVRLKRENIMGGVGRGFRITMEAFNKERLALAAYSVGAIEACLTAARRYARERKSFGRPLQKHQLVGFMLADMLTRRDAAWLLLMETAWLYDQEREATGEGEEGSSSRRRGRQRQHNGVGIELAARSAEVKLLASTYARECANMALQIHGGAGYMEEYPVARLYRDVKLAEIGGGASEIQKQIIARAELRRLR
ncbi:MAG: acyl-CoA dehydrogenase family protein [Leptospirales bacterium]|nr:acyl-CoA dehydrogenase family protein [Leptospirales bacterium]